MKRKREYKYSMKKITEKNINDYKMGLTTGDILAIVFGSILGLVIIGYLIYILVFRKKQVITTTQIKQHLTDNPSSREEVSRHLQSLEKPDEILTKVELTTTPVR